MKFQFLIGNVLAMMYNTSKPERTYTFQFLIGNVLARNYHGMARSREIVSIPYRQCLGRLGETVQGMILMKFQFLIGNVLAGAFCARHLPYHNIFAVKRQPSSSSHSDLRR